MHILSVILCNWFTVQAEIRANNASRESDESFHVSNPTSPKAYDTQTDPHLASDTLEPVLMFTSEYYFCHAGCCCQAGGVFILIILII